MRVGILGVVGFAVCLKDAGLPDLILIRDFSGCLDG